MNGLNAVVEQVVDEKTRAGEMFTAFDVTTEVRKRGHFCKHADCRDIVHDLYQRGIMGIAYTRTSITVTTGTPWLYHRSVDDPQTYAANIPASNTVVNAASNVVAIPNFQAVNLPIPPQNGTVNSPNKLLGRTTDARGSLTVPSKLLKNLGFVPNEKVKVFIEPNKLEIPDKNYKGIGQWYKVYTVNRSNHIRITKGVLQKIGGSAYNCDLDTNKIIISAA